MGSVTYSNGISILELIVYLPAFFAASFLVYRHGVRRSGGFIFLVIFTIARVVGSACNLATINNPSTDLAIAAAICSSIGLSPLLMTCSGLLSRANECLPRPTIPKYAFSFFRILTIAALAVTISGITSDMTPQGLRTPNTEVKAGMILYIISWAILCVFLVIVAQRRPFLPKGEERTLLTVAISAPFLLVRIIYAVLIWFLADGAFNAVDGNYTAQLFLAVFEEIVVVGVCLGVGFKLRVRAGSRDLKGQGVAVGGGSEMA
ncbi:uncharacterized protein BDV14DRAFT_204708 [Aspergillus stella-maris]|uniref:uncharacterized protein n=1 Tax=Aspergillus stella-maris TaxID=1810926 RepID=UPI003CCE44FD